MALMLPSDPDLDRPDADGTEGPGGPEAVLDDEAEAGRQFETMKHLARTERRRIRLVVDFYPSGRIGSNAFVPLGTRELPIAERPARPRPRRA